MSYKRDILINKKKEGERERGREGERERGREGERERGRGGEGEGERERGREGEERGGERKIPGARERSSGSSQASSTISYQWGESVSCFVEVSACLEKVKE